MRVCNGSLPGDPEVRWCEGQPGAAGNSLRLHVVMTDFFSLREGSLFFPQLGWGTLSAFLLCAGTVRQKEEKRTEKKFRRTGLLLRRTPGGYGVAATCAAILAVADAGEARVYPRRRLRDPAVFIRGSQRWMQRLAGVGAARRCRSGLGASGQLLPAG